MGKENYEMMESFALRDIPGLDVCVLGALELFIDSDLSHVNIEYKRPLVVGSGNAEATGRIIFEDIDAVFANESDYEKKLKNIKGIDGVVVVSASGGKHAPKIIKTAKKYKKRVSLVTNTSRSLAEKALNLKKDKIYLFPKQREPYTYNTSTYMGMILGKTEEDPKRIHNYIEKNISKMKFPDFAKYDKYYILVPAKFSGVRRMLTVKFIELFGRQVARDVETIEYVKHATTIVESNELFISIGCENKIYGKNRLYIPLPKSAGYGMMMAVSYYVIGKIQGEKEDYFRRGISGYMKKISKMFGEKMKVIVNE